MVVRLPRGSKWKLRIVLYFVACFCAITLLSKWIYVSKLRATPYVRIPAYLLTERNNGLTLGLPVFVDTKREELLAFERSSYGKGEVTRNLTLSQVQHLRDIAMNQRDSLELTYRGRAGEVIKYSSGRIFNVFIWDDICGESLENLFNYPLFPYMPSRKRFSKAFKLPHYGQNYAVWLVGYMIPFCDGKFLIELKIKSGNSEVWISDDHTRTKLKRILKTTGKGRKTKIEIELKKDRRYHFDVFHKEGQSNSHFDLTVKHPDEKCKKNKQSVTFEPFISAETIWGYKRPVVEFDPELLAQMKEKASPAPQISHTKRDEIFKFPYMDENDVKNLLPVCKYNPSYIVQNQLNKYEGVWETHFSSIYPSDDSNITDVLSSGERQIIFGNDLLSKDVAVKVVHGIMGVIKQKNPGKYQLSSILNIEENVDLEKGTRYLVELEILNVKTKEPVRFSEYIYLPRGSSSFCFPDNFKWNKKAVVNVILTVGGQGRWAKYFIDAIEEIYEVSKDENINLIIVDFDSKDVDLKDELERSKIPHFTLLHRFGGFYKSEAIQQATNTITDPNSIVLLMDLHLIIPSNFIDIVRKHCVQGKMAFNPILARLNCAANHRKPEGFWENVGYGLFATYKSDWDVFGGMNYAAFKDHWGGEDWEMLDRVLMSRLEVERLKVKSLFHVFHTKKGMWHNFGT